MLTIRHLTQPGRLTTNTVFTIMRSGTTPSPRRKLGASGNQKGPPQMYALSPLDLCIWFVNGKRDFASVVKVADLKIGR